MIIPLLMSFMRDLTSAHHFFMIIYLYISNHTCILHLDSDFWNELVLMSYLMHHRVDDYTSTHELHA